MKIASTFLIALLLLTGGAMAAEWGDHEQNLMGLGTRIHALRTGLSGLLQQSALTVDPEVKRALMAEILKIENELRTETEKMNRELEHIRYEHPERGQDFKPLVTEFNLELPDILSASPRLDELLKESKELVEMLYGISFSPERTIASEVSAPKPAPAPRWVLEK